jgi:hypothetical protein
MTNARNAGGASRGVVLFQRIGPRGAVDLRRQDVRGKHGPRVREGRLPKASLSLLRHRAT